MKQQALPIQERVVEKALQVNRTHFDAAHVRVARHVVEVIGRIHAVEDRLEGRHPRRGGRALELRFSDQLGDPARFDPLARGKGAGGTRIEGRNRRSQFPFDQGAADHLVVDVKAIQIILVEEMSEGAVADVVQQSGNPQRLLDAGGRRNIR